MGSLTHNLNKPVSVNPLKTSPSLGSAYVLNGIKSAVSLFHAAPGCSFLGKVLLIQHLREPVNVIGSDMMEMTTIMGGWDLLSGKVKEIIEKQKPSIIGIVSSALSEVRGEDIKSIIKKIKEEVKDCPELIYISAPDYAGGFNEGYAKAVECLVDELAVAGTIDQKQVNVIPSGSLSLGDIEELKAIIESFGLKPIILPDLSLSVDGSRNRYSIVPTDGTTKEEIMKMGSSIATIMIGSFLDTAVEKLKNKFDIPVFKVPIPVGLQETDHFLRLLMELSGQEPSDNLKRWRNRYIDFTIDTHLLMANKKISLGLEYDLIVSLSQFLEETGAIIEAGITATLPARQIDRKMNFTISIGDLEDLEMKSESTDLIISNSHANELSQRLNKPLLKMGFPIFDNYGENFKYKIGYRGSINLLTEIANALSTNERSH